MTVCSLIPYQWNSILLAEAILSFHSANAHLLNIFSSLWSEYEREEKIEGLFCSTFSCSKSAFLLRFFKVIFSISMGHRHRRCHHCPHRRRLHRHHHPSPMPSLSSSSSSCSRVVNVLRIRWQRASIKTKLCGFFIIGRQKYQTWPHLVYVTAPVLAE